MISLRALSWGDSLGYLGGSSVITRVRVRGRGIERRRQGNHVDGDWNDVATSQGAPGALQKQPEEEGIGPRWVY